MTNQAENVILDDNEYEKRADYLLEQDIVNWNVDLDHFKSIQTHLLSRTPYLVAGPRGTGKTHQFKLIHYKCTQDINLPLSLYLTFNRYYRLEPLLTNTSSAIAIFHSWVLAKINLEILKYAQRAEIKLENDSSISIDNLEQFINITEQSITSVEHDSLRESLSIKNTKKLITQLTHFAGRKRSILLFDDAALTLTHDFMIEFFEIFRNLKTAIITPKASVYPGTTQYGPRFHLGQDAEKVDIWPFFQEKNYSEFLDNLILKRFPTFKNEVNQNIIDLFKIASFGIPRGFISLIFAYKNNDDPKQQTKFNKIFEDRSELIKEEYLSLKGKLPQYSSIIDIGYIFFEKSLAQLKEEARSLNGEKSIIIGLRDDLSLQQERMINLLIEAGLLFSLTPIKHGENRIYKRLIPHSIFLINNKVLTPSSRGFNISEIVNSFNLPNTKHPTRRNLNTILTSEEFNEIKLSLSLCQVCDEPRVAENQKFCHNCGNKLQKNSTFKTCTQVKVEDLPLTDWQKNTILKGTKIKIVEDFLTLPDPASELKRAFGIGKVRSEKIFKNVMKYVEEFLS